MRPVEKWPVGYISHSGETVQNNYSPHGKAYTMLEENLDMYCSYCEVFSSDLEVEHIISQNQNSSLSTVWHNFLLACGRCNGADNKGNKPVNFSHIYFPHLNNTLYIFEYGPAGFISVRATLSPAQRLKTEALMGLIGLDKYPGNPKYSAINPRDKRWALRLEAWEQAVRKLNDYTIGVLSSPEKVAEFARSRGFFSVWYSVFQAHPEVLKELIRVFRGTALNCFDPVTYLPIPRNPANPSDPI